MQRSDKPLLCRLNLHRYDLYASLTMISFIERCRCGKGRVFHAMSLTCEPLTEEQMADIEETKRLAEGRGRVPHDVD